MVSSSWRRDVFYWYESKDVFFLFLSDINLSLIKSRVFPSKGFIIANFYFNSHFSDELL